MLEKNFFFQDKMIIFILFLNLLDLELMKNI
jgi:hypothetical protein